MYISYILKIVLFLVVLLTLYYLYKFLVESKIVESTATKVFNITKEKNINRTKEKEKILLEIGESEDLTFISKLDLLIQRSQINRYLGIPLNPEIYISVNIILGGLAFIIAIKLTKFWLLGVIGALLITIVLYLILYILSGNNYEKIDRQALILIDVMENYANIYDDIVQIIGKASQHLEYPLKDYMEDFQNESINTGDTQKAFRKLTRKIENSEIRDLFSNLESCSHNRANYKDIIKGSRTIMKNYIDGKEERKEMSSDGRKSLVLMLLMGGFILNMLKGMVNNMKQALLNTQTGNFILLYGVIVIFLIIWFFINYDKEVED